MEMEFYKEYMSKDAEILLFGVGSIASECREAVNLLREEGLKVGLISLKLYRPFPVNHLRKAFSKCQTVVVFDRDIGYGYEGILAYELKAAMYAADNHPLITGYIVGLGGRDVDADQIMKGVHDVVNEPDKEALQKNTHTRYLGLKLADLGYKEDE